MTLIVGYIDGDDIHIVSDTLVTWDDGQVREPDDHTIPKIAILRPDLAVALSGTEPDARLRDLAYYRDYPLDELLASLREDTCAGFIVAAPNPPRLWSVYDGMVYQRTNRGIAWDGDEDAYKIFADRFATDWIGTTCESDIGFRVMTSMQALTSFPRVATVGGLSLRAASDANGFHFVADRTTVFLGPSWYVMPGEDPTRGALGVFMQTSGIGRLYTHQDPDAAILIAASFPAEFITEAQRTHGQVLAHPGA